MISACRYHKWKQYIISGLPLSPDTTKHFNSKVNSARRRNSNESFNYPSIRVSLSRWENFNSFSKFMHPRSHSCLLLLDCSLPQPRILFPWKHWAKLSPLNFSRSKTCSVVSRPLFTENCLSRMKIFSLECNHRQNYWLIVSQWNLSSPDTSSCLYASFPRIERDSFLSQILLIRQKFVILYALTSFTLPRQVFFFYSKSASPLKVTKTVWN